MAITKKENSVLIETYKGIDIYYDKDFGELSAVDKKTGEKFKGKYLFEIEKNINEPYWEEIHKFGFTIGGYFRKEIQKVEAKKQDRKSKKCVWEVIESTDNSYDVGKLLDNWREVKVYPYTEERQKMFNKVKELEQEIKKIELKQREFVEKL